jgi:hypothetical protein
VAQKSLGCTGVQGSFKLLTPILHLDDSILIFGILSRLVLDIGLFNHVQDS